MDHVVSATVSDNNVANVKPIFRGGAISVTKIRLRPKSVETKTRPKQSTVKSVTKPRTENSGLKHYITNKHWWIQLVNFETRLTLTAVYAK